MKFISGFLRCTGTVVSCWAPPHLVLHSSYLVVEPKLNFEELATLLDQRCNFTKETNLPAAASQRVRFQYVPGVVDIHNIRDNNCIRKPPFKICYLEFKSSGIGGVLVPFTARLRNITKLCCWLLEIFVLSCTRSAAAAAAAVVVFVVVVMNSFQAVSQI